jgi:hypothetical protein
MASAFVYWTSDGGGGDGGRRAEILHRWIVSQGNASLIVYGGDVYEHGKPQEFAKFLAQMGNDVSLMCETTGNHDWMTRTSDRSDAQPVGYEGFWSKFPPPRSKQPIDKSKVAGARYEHFIDLNGWRLIFPDTGALEYLPAWPMDNPAREQWLKDAIAGGNGRAQILFTHFSRLSWGQHGDNKGVSKIWEALFDAAGQPRAVCTIGGHDHNVSLYKFRDRDLQETDATHGIQIWVNGMGGAGPYRRLVGTSTGMIYPKSAADADDPIMYCVTQVELVDATHATVRLLSFGSSPKSDTVPKLVLQQEYQA